MTRDKYNKILQKINELINNESLRTRAVIQTRMGNVEDRDLYSLAVEKTSEKAKTISDEIISLLSTEIENGEKEEAVNEIKY